MTADETNDADEGSSSSMIYGEGQAAWLAVVTIVAFGALALAVVAVVMASGDDGGGGGSAAPAGPSDALVIEASDFAFAPEAAAALADTDVSVTLENVGAVEHNWTVLEAGTTVGSEADFEESMVLAAVGDVAAGETTEGSVNLAEGEYQVICTISGHLDAGMEGTVTAGGSGA
ncbi:MAG: plastocyanin/azurin family copper-binding protein [Ilumatobacteraceae bacterium]